MTKTFNIGMRSIHSEIYKEVVLIYNTNIDNDFIRNYWLSFVRIRNTVFDSDELEYLIRFEIEKLYEKSPNA